MIFTGAALNASTTIVSNIENTDIYYTWYFGQSFEVTGSNYTLDSISIYYYSDPCSGSGTIYLFDSAYTGSPDSLSASSCLATGTWDSTSKSWVFSSGYELIADKTYYFYTNTAITATFSNMFNPYSSGTMYYSPSAGSNFSELSSYSDLAFSVTGTAVPEPAACAGLIGLIALGAAGGRRLFARRS